jgi:hypothetical protein
MPTIQRKPTSLSSDDAITERANAALLKLLEIIERDIERGTLMDSFGVYETLCRAEGARRGRAG